MIHSSPYLEWIKAQEFPGISLARSGMHFAGNAHDLGLQLEELPLSEQTSYGSPHLKAILSQRYGVHQENIVLNMGTSGVNYLIFKTLFSPGDEVIVENPVYDPLPNAIKALGAKVKLAPRRPQNRYQFDVDEIRTLFNKKTKALVLTNLHNPTGVLIPDEDIRSLADLAKSHNAFLIVDEIYLEFYFCKGVQTAFLLCDNIITTSSLTKAFGLGSLRVGWSFAPQEVVKKAEKMFDLMIGGTPCAMEYIIYKVLSSKILLNRFTEQAFGLIKNNLPLVEQFIDLQTDLQWIKPDGGIICFPRTTSAQKTEKLLRILSDEYQTWVIPGKFFFDPAGFRLGYGVESELLIKGLKNIDRALKKI